MISQSCPGGQGWLKIDETNVLESLERRLGAYLIKQFCSRQHAETILQQTARIMQGCRNNKPGDPLKSRLADLVRDTVSVLEWPLKCSTHLARLCIS